MNLNLLVLSFVTIFLAELADRSNIAIFALSGSSKYPRAVYLGAASALLAANLLGALIGGKLATLLPIHLVKIIAILGFAYLAIRLLWLEKRSSRNQENSNSESVNRNSPSYRKFIYDPHDRWSIFGSTFLTIFLTSLGDGEQIATLLLSAQSQSPVIVFIGAALAVVATSLIAVLLGQGVARWLPPNRLKTVSGILLLLIAVWLFFEIIHPGGEIELFEFEL
jgi:Ca2+/H+ antiporter, TMEM165/GDT1 family